MLVRDLPTEECRETLSTSTFGRLACAHENQPYVVPIHFAVEGDYIYAFSMAGQKIEWMRANPRVCLELDSIHRQDDWTSIVVVGRFEELTPAPEFASARILALALLEKRAMWWEPGAVDLANGAPRLETKPVVFRIAIERLTGRQAIPESGDGAVSSRPWSSRPREVG